MNLRKFKCLTPYGNYPYGEQADYTMDFTTGVLPQQSVFDRPPTLPSIATGIVNGRVYEFLSGAPRFCDEGLLLENPTTNYFTDPRLENAKYNIGSTTPFIIFAFPHFTFQVVGRGIENGIQFFDVRCQRTAQAGTSYAWAIQDPLLVPINAGGISTPQWFITSAYVKIIGGSITNITSFRVGWQQFLADGITPATGGGNSFNPVIDINLLNNTNPLISNRVYSGANSTNVAGVYLAPTIGLAVTTNAAVDITFRIGGFQFESSGVIADTNPQQLRETSYASSLILPPVGSPQRTSRAADFLVCPAMKNSLSSYEQSMIIEGTHNATVIAPAGATLHVGAIDNGFNSIRSMCFQNSNNGLWRSTINSDASTSNLQTPVANFSSKYILGAANKEGAASFAVDGVLVTNQTGNTNNFTGGSTSRIMLNDTQAYWSSKSFIKRVRVWNHMLSDADLIDYTSLPSWEWSFYGNKGFPSSILTFTRTGTAYVQYDYKLSSLPANTPGIGNSVIHLDPTSTNGVRNARLEGGSLGVTLPTNVTLINSAGSQTCTMVGQGTDSNGWPYVDLRIQKTVGTNTGAFRIGFEVANIILVAPGETWTTSMYIQRIAGTWNNVDVSGSSINVGCLTFNSSNAVVAGDGAEVQYPYTSFEVPLGQFRTQSTFTAAATTAYLRPTISWNSPATGPIDITLRVSCPQAEKLPFATQPMLPVAGTPAASTRADSTLILPTLSNISYNGNEGTFILEFLCNYGSSTTMTADGCLLGLDNTTTSNTGLRIYVDSNKKIAVSFKNAGADIFSPMVLADTLLYNAKVNKVAVSYKNLGGNTYVFKAAANSNPIQSVGIVTTIPATFSRINFLNPTATPTSYAPAGTGLRSFKYYNKALSDSSITLESHTS